LLPIDQVMSGTRPSTFSPNSFCSSTTTAGTHCVRVFRTGAASRGACRKVRSGHGRYLSLWASCWAFGGDQAQVIVHGLYTFEHMAENGSSDDVVSDEEADEREEGAEHFADDEVEDPSRCPSLCPTPVVSGTSKF
jgi:hypothetical protein